MTDRRCLLVAASALVMLAVSCGRADAPIDAGTTTPAVSGTEPVGSPTSTTADANEAVVAVRLELTPGECQTCEYLVTIDEDGATYRRSGIVVPVALPDGALAAATADLDGLTGETTDCGREVDGDAPVLTIESRAQGESATTTEIDLCYVELVAEHPLAELIRDVGATGDPAIPEVSVVPPIDRAEPWRFAELRDDTSTPAIDWPESIDPTTCRTATSHLALPLGSAWVVTDLDLDSAGDERCLVWLGGETENPFDDGLPSQFCALPTNHEPLEVYVGDGGPAQTSSSPWCVYRPAFPYDELPALDTFDRAIVCPDGVVVVHDTEDVAIVLATGILQPSGVVEGMVVHPAGDEPCIRSDARRRWTIEDGWASVVGGDLVIDVLWLFDHRALEGPASFPIAG